MDDTSIPALPELGVEAQGLDITPAGRPNMQSLEEYELRLHRHAMWNSSGAVVGEVLDSTQGLVDEYSSIALSVLAELGDFPEGTIPPSDIDLNIPQAPAIGDISGDKPTRPTYTTPDVGEPPDLRGDLLDITTQTIDKPIFIYPDAPTEQMNWQEDPYLSELLDNLKASLNDIILHGGTGIDPAWEQAVWDRAVSRLSLAHEEKYEEAERYFSSKGYAAPPGALVARLNLLNREKLEQESLISSDIAAKQLEISKEHNQFCLDLAQKTEAMTMNQKDQYYNRALDAMKATIGLLYENYRAQLDGIRLKVETYQAELQAEATRVGTIAAANKSITDTLQVETQAWATRLEAEFSIIDSIIKMYVAELGGYEAEVRAEGIKLGALVDRYRAQVGAAEVQGQISLGEYEALVKAILGEIELKLGSQKEAGRIAAQVAASALSAFNASASISDSNTTGKHYNEQRSTSLSSSFQQSLSNNLGITKSQQESVADAYEESTKYSYTGSI